MSTVLEATALSKRFGDVVAVDEVSVRVDEGEVVGLLGANGAGKTTLLRMVLGLLAPDGGRVRLLGRRPGRATRVQIGYVPQHLGLYTELSVGAHRRFHRDVFGPATRGDDPADDPDDPTDGLADDAVVGTLPLGAQRRLAFELALAHDPRLLVLDEPTSGVGPLGRARLWEAIADAAARGRAALVTTHHLAEAEQCDRLVVMAAGRVVASGSVEDVVGDATAVVVRGAPPGRVLTALDDAGLVGTLSPGGVAVPGHDIDAVRDAIDAASLDARVEARAATLEERFAELASSSSRQGS